MSTPAKPVDEFDAVRAIVEVLREFKQDEQARIVRWAQEKLGFAGGPASAMPGYAMPGMAVPGVGGAPMRVAGKDIASFVGAKTPENDVQFAAVVAYYYAFEAAEIDKKAEISAADLQNATRLANWPRLKKPINTLHNAVTRGYLDKGTARGAFKISTVGENLVAMSMPTATSATTGARVRRAPTKKK